MKEITELVNKINCWKLWRKLWDFDHHSHSERERETEREEREWANVCWCFVRNLPRCNIYEYEFEWTFHSTTCLIIALSFKYFFTFIALKRDDTAYNQPPPPLFSSPETCCLSLNPPHTLREIADQMSTHIVLSVLRLNVHATWFTRH